MGLDIISYSKTGNIGNKKTELINIRDNDIVYYDSIKNKFVNKRNKTIVEQWQPNYEYEKGELFHFDGVFWIANQTHTSNNGTSPDIDEINLKNHMYTATYL